MTQDERWLAKYNEIMAFIETNKRNPSKYRIEEHDMLNWLKANRKKMNADGLKPVFKSTISQFMTTIFSTQYGENNQVVTKQSLSSHQVVTKSGLSWDQVGRKLRKCCL